MNRPPLGYGMRHVALFVRDLPACERFYVELLGMEVQWRPDDQNVYLTSGGDNLALHQASTDHARDEAAQRLDHIGFFVSAASDVDDWFAWLTSRGVPMRTEPRTHRDGARSFYCYDPDGTHLQIIHHPPVNAWEDLRGIA
ncbi:MAG: VOC family protein [Chromatiaceae bacterium]|nr:VOC family protein [Gammaproteobacteria bacterium]MCP5300334.1 VOC family protein [Chromatiaceae bacterium]MCP5422406.1 VOC family protein [Chromatiaceae bacterium]